MFTIEVPPPTVPTRRRDLAKSREAGTSVPAIEHPQSKRSSSPPIPYSVQPAPPARSSEH
jgi:hypothetical protein